MKDSENVSSQLNTKKSKNKNKDKDNDVETVITNDFKEKIMHYIKIDDLIRKKQEEIKDLKEKKEEKTGF